MGRKAKAHDDVEKPSTKWGRFTTSTTHSCHFLDTNDSCQRSRRNSRPTSAKASSKTNSPTQRDCACASDALRSFESANLQSGRSSPAYDNIPAPYSTTGFHCSSDSDSVQQTTDSDSDSCIVLTKRGRKCLFYIRNPHLHARCARTRLSPGQPLTDHFFQRHLHPPVCWRCGTMFECAAQRNQHVLFGGCELVEPLPTFEGVGEGTLYELDALVSSWERSPLQLSDEEKYAKIWELVFPSQ